ncbi:Gfo/Idh/MocA family oxidoreductase [Haliovirga abyssi]|uniref:Oxidoreductase n=1 Tax=Haliovirga abyssi TaxID=2996794 RepID=A0AAU9DUV4_9FUSO|nr:Gfo/Idh/MocA family oxidoreductase [Haliovirga abyssi]BDU51039.1 oxidoreductase [Haliovirga abyssi]
MKKLNIGIAGFGLGGRVFHAPILASLEDYYIIKKIMTSNKENIKKANETYPEAEIVSKYEEILYDKSIDIVVIALPNLLHKEFAEKALFAGKHVVVEKPFTVTTKEAIELIKIAKNMNKIVSVNHNRRWDSDFLTVKKVIKSKTLGKIVEYEAHFDRFRNYIKDGTWKEAKKVGSGILYDLGSHLIDQSLELFGRPKEVFADLRMQRENSTVIDNFELILYYDELKVTLKASMLVREKGYKYSVFGREGTFVKSGTDIQEEELRKGNIPKDISNWGKEPENIWGEINSTINGMNIKGKIESENGDYRNFYINIYKAIAGEENLSVTPESATDVIHIIELAMLSNKEKRIVKF